MIQLSKESKIMGQCASARSLLDAALVRANVSAFALVKYILWRGYYG